MRQISVRGGAELNPHRLRHLARQPPTSTRSASHLKPQFNFHLRRRCKTTKAAAVSTRVSEAGEQVEEEKEEEKSC